MSQDFIRYAEQGFPASSARLPTAPDALLPPLRAPFRSGCRSELRE
ncbi:hypothetical protein [Streptomyces sp. NPDC006183]